MHSADLFVNITFDKRNYILIQKNIVLNLLETRTQTSYVQSSIRRTIFSQTDILAKLLYRLAGSL